MHPKSSRFDVVINVLVCACERPLLVIVSLFGMCRVMQSTGWHCDLVRSYLNRLNRNGLDADVYIAEHTQK